LWSADAGVLLHGFAELLIGDHGVIAAGGIEQDGQAAWEQASTALL
jgi:hypothetical protein